MSERLEKLDMSRNQFVSNASHELKTPLSTMKILLETLLYQESYDPAMQKEFLTDINKEIDRLNRIVSDLLTLVNIDSGGMHLNVADVRLRDIVTEQVKRLFLTSSQTRSALQKEFLADINKEIDRLNRIVSDLLTLVNIDSDGMRLNVADIRLRDIVTEQVKRLSPLARERGIELSCLMRDPCETVGDSLKLQQVFYNVIDNAIKYTPRGGEVRVELARAGKRAVVRVEDTGIGIPADDLPHIFDRFYRVDKARSRETGGTGSRPVHRAPDRAFARWRHTRRERGKQGHHVHHRTSHRHEITAASRRP